MVIEPPYYPIIYVRGYAMRRRDIEATVETPYMGFNLGSTKIRQRASGAAERLIFESPLVRLMKDYCYRDTYCDGAEKIDDLPKRPVFIYRYYDLASRAFGDGDRPEIEEYARGLDGLIGEVRCLVGGPKGSFGVYLVAHSMGGLICRAFLQNDGLGTPRNREAVKKVFTYATPHNGIEVKGLRNRLPPFWNADNFERQRMREYLAIGSDTAANSLNGKYSPERFFSLVGTNYRDYGKKRYVVDEDSDGLVLIRNAFVRGGPRAFVHRSHSGPLGIVNSEEGYQILRRFLFGDVRVDGRLRLIDASLPASIEKMRKNGSTVEASYHFEVVAGVRGARGWDMERRTVRERCAVFRTYDALRGCIEAGPVSPEPRLFTLFLAEKLRTSGHNTLAFSVGVRVPVPDYEVKGRVHSADHFEGSVLFDDRLVVKIGERSGGESPRELRYGWRADGAGSAPHSVKPEKGSEGEAPRYMIRLKSRSEPAFSADLEVTVQE